MKKVIRNQFVPSAYREKFLERLDRLKQSSKSVKEYHMELLNLMMKKVLLSLTIKVEKQQQLLATWLSSNFISIEQLTSTSCSTPVIKEFVEYAVSGDVYVDDDSMVQQSSKRFMGCEKIEKEERKENNLREEKNGKKSDGFVVCTKDINVNREKESQSIPYLSEFLHRTCLKYPTYGKALYVLHLIVQGILNKRHAQSTELLESCSLIKQDSRTNLFEEGENDTCSGGHFRHFRHKEQNDNIVVFKDQNTRRITLYRFWTSRRLRIRIKRKCIDLEHKEHASMKLLGAQVIIRRELS
ncbi:hypothetical protein PIB30_054936 [Stylosanthes scabra]|uniref:Retrotransposon gag domain-containing protein n=1 Tax=Stylosanthes scabra TaxID=79078 RepID=A0ABU6XH48_9FABA|nr:hypothetical protein [Stylosanthes scabra]